MGCMKIAPIVFQVFASLLSIAAICLTLAAVLTHHWQHYTTFDQGMREFHAHGLWMDCIETEVFSQGSKNKECSYKFHSDDSQMHSQGIGGHSHRHPNTQISDGQTQFSDQHSGHQHKLLSLPSRQTILALLCLATVLALIGLLVSFCAPCVKWCAVVWSVLGVLSTILALAGIITFFINSHDVELSYISRNSRTVQSHGYSFYCGVVGCAMFLFSTILAVLTTVLYFTVRRQDNDYAGKNVNKTWPKIYNHHNTAV